MRRPGCRSSRLIGGGAGEGKKKLKKKGKLTVKPQIKFTPDGGEPATEKVSVKLKYKK